MPVLPSSQRIAPGCRGTADTVIQHEDTLSVIDLKTGRLKVEAKENTQLMLYGLGALNDIADHSFIDTIRLVIVQPRLDHIDQWYIKKDELIKWGHEVVRPAAAKTMASDPEFNPSPAACQWCKARTVCKALAQQQLEIAQRNTRKTRNRAETNEKNVKSRRETLEKRDIAPRKTRNT